MPEEKNDLPLGLKKVQAWASILSSLLIPLVIGGVGLVINRSIQTKELNLVVLNM